MYGCKTASPRTIFPLSATRPSNFKFVHTCKTENASIVRAEDRADQLAALVAPMYATEAAVTSAIASGTFKGFAPTAYAEAIAYQKKLKALSRPAFVRRAKSANVSTVPSLNFRPGYVN